MTGAPQHSGCPVGVGRRTRMAATLEAPPKDKTETVARTDIRNIAIIAYVISSFCRLVCVWAGRV